MASATLFSYAGGGKRAGYSERERRFSKQETLA